MHEDVEIIVFLSTEDDSLYLWSHEWDEKLYGTRKLIRAAATIDECDTGILQGLHVLEFEFGGWLKIDGYGPDESVERRAVEGTLEEDIYGCGQNEPMQM